MEPERVALRLEDNNQDDEREGNVALELLDHVRSDWLGLDVEVKKPTVAELVVLLVAVGVGRLVVRVSDSRCVVMPVAVGDSVEVLRRYA